MHVSPASAAPIRSYNLELEVEDKVPSSLVFKSTWLQLRPVLREGISLLVPPAHAKFKNPSDVRCTWAWYVGTPRGKVML